MNTVCVLEILLPFCLVWYMVFRCLVVSCYLVFGCLVCCLLAFAGSFGVLVIWCLCWFWCFACFVIVCAFMLVRFVVLVFLSVWVSCLVFVLFGGFDLFCCDLFCCDLFWVLVESCAVFVLYSTCLIYVITLLFCQFSLIWIFWLVWFLVVLGFDWFDFACGLVILFVLFYFIRWCLLLFCFAALGFDYFDCYSFWCDWSFCCFFGFFALGFFELRV